MSKNDKTPRAGFFATLSHRVRQPASAALEVLERLAEQEGDAPRAALLRDLAGQTRDVVASLNEILDLERLRAGNFPVSRGRFDLRRALRNAADRAAGDGTAVTLDVHPAVPAFVYGDAARFSQALGLLLRTGVPAVGHIPIEVTLESETENRVVVAVAVTADHAPKNRDAATGLEAQLLALLAPPPRRHDHGSVRRIGVDHHDAGPPIRSRRAARRNGRRTGNAFGIASFADRRRPGRPAPRRRSLWPARVRVAR
ncbi:MAG: hypothetical protein M5R36_13640 [Deltaproteobacteria bacterium]|nr:hypothetical protein [Deltaproteobacteria bacterium]